MTRALVFTRTKHGADKVARHLSKSGIRAEAIHGNKSQNARQRALVNFKVEQAAGAGGHGRGRARAGYRRSLARRQLRHAERARNLRSPHRPHGPRRGRRASRFRSAITTSASTCATSKSCCARKPRSATTTRCTRPRSRRPTGSNSQKSQRPAGPPPRKPHAAGPSRPATALAPPQVRQSPGSGLAGQRHRLHDHVVVDRGPTARKAAALADRGIKLRVEPRINLRGGIQAR